MHKIKKVKVKLLASRIGLGLKSLSNGVSGYIDEGVSSNSFDVVNCMSFKSV